MQVSENIDEPNSTWHTALLSLLLPTGCEGALGSPTEWRLWLWLWLWLWLRLRLILGLRLRLGVAVLYIWRRHERKKGNTRKLKCSLRWVKSQKQTSYFYFLRRVKRVPVFPPRSGVPERFFYFPHTHIREGVRTYERVYGCTVYSVSIHVHRPRRYTIVSWYSIPVFYIPLDLNYKNSCLGNYIACCVAWWLVKN